MSFTCFHLVEAPDRAVGEPRYVAIELAETTRTTRSLAMKPRPI